VLSLLGGRKELLDRAAELLLEKETLEEAEFAEMVKGAVAV